MRTPSAVALALALSVGSVRVGVAQPASLQAFAVPFAGGYGQVEVGGPTVGLGFHQSRPLPSRVSFYRPVANSLDLSTDYWTRDQAPLPLRVTLVEDGVPRAFGLRSMPYTWTPATVTFAAPDSGWFATVSYRFAERSPVVLVAFTFRNTGPTARTLAVAIDLVPTLRTCQTYAWRRPAALAVAHNAPDVVARFDAADTDSAAVFIADVSPGTGTLAADSLLRVRHVQRVAPGDSLVVRLLIGSTGARDVDAVRAEARRTWAADVAAYEARVADGARIPIRVPDAALMQTAAWSGMVLQADQHRLDGHLVPMPAPAEYNFFFTHDALLTDLGAVHFDTARVRRDLDYLRLRTGPDSLLVHAYYWRDDGFKTETAAPDNWNHLWLLILGGSYLRHTADEATLARLFPIFQKSRALVLTQRGADGLMHGTRPDWWDIGNVRAPRAYLTILTIRALREYAAVARALGRAPEEAAASVRMADEMQANLPRLWDDARGYLMSGLSEQAPDPHLYAGSLLATAFGYLDPARSERLLETAERELLDPEIGMRNAWPPDFHELREAYRFNGDEVGAPYLYFNGAVWPHNVAWHVLAQLGAGRADDARQALRRYLTLGGIAASPRGQPAFFEYRATDPDSPRYGAIDKPTFLWTGGWFLQALYRLAGAREDEWNLFLSPDLPADFDTLQYRVFVHGTEADVTVTGQGRAFRSIEMDGVPVATAVLTGPVGRIEARRGSPEAPYLAHASATVEAVAVDAPWRTMRVRLRGEVGQPVQLTVLAPPGLRRALVGLAPLARGGDAEAASFRYTGTLPAEVTDVVIRFE